MRSGFLGALAAIPLSGLERAADVWLAAVLAVLVAVLLVPLPSTVIDGLLALSLVGASLVLASVLVADRPLALSTFPSILLVTTLFRLALNVSTTRMILVDGKAGRVVEAFGRFVVDGDLVVGLVVFAVLTLVQFMVIGKGAERVAEVAARFTLDAMPGKQMAIDAAERAGALTDAQAQARRDELGRESQFYGAMDGAMKFIRGDALAGLAITALNLGAGFGIGVLKFSLTPAQAAQTYTMLTIGDGLVSQLPALLITLSAGLLTTRVAARPRERGDLGGTLHRELFGHPRALAMASAFAVMLACLPGLPVWPFLLAGTLFAVGLVHRAFVVRGGEIESSRSRVEALKARVGDKVRQAKAQRALADQMINIVHPLGIDLDPYLSRACGFEVGVDDADTELIGALLPEVRDAMFSELGVRFPSVRVRTSVPGMSPSTFAVRINDVPVADGQIEPGRVLVAERSEVLKELGVDARATTHPWGDLPASIVPVARRAVIEDLGYTVWSPSGQVVLHLARIMRAQASLFVGLQETTAMLEKLEQAYPSVVREAVPKVVTVPQLTDILRRLLDERVSIRDLRSVLEALVESAEQAHDPIVRTEIVRAALGRQIAHAHAGLGRQLSALLLDPSLEALIEDAVVHRAGSSYVALEPSLRTAFIDEVLRSVGPALAAGQRPVLLTRAEIRRYVRKLVDVDLPDIAVLSFQELPPQQRVAPLGRVTLPESAWTP